MYLADYHTHCQWSMDSTTPMADMALAAAELGMKEICFTDHVEPFIWGDGSPTWMLLPLVLLAIAALAGVYREYLGHSEMLEGVDGELAEKWRKLWKWYIISFAVTIGGIFAALISPVLAIFVVLGGAIAAVVVSVLKLVYLYRTAKVFRALAEEVEGAEDGI